MDSICVGCLSVNKVEIEIKRASMAQAETFIICPTFLNLVKIHGPVFKIEDEAGVLAPLITDCDDRVPPV